MAGGKGKRLEPITKIIPKPLVPLGEKTILELIMDKFNHYGLSQFYLSINYKANIIKAFFDDTKSLYDIKYVTEKLFLGTIGSLRLIKNQINTPVFVTNCDVLLEIDYRKVYASKKSQGGGVFLDSIHEIDYAYWIFGKFKVQNFIKKKISKLEINVEDFININLVNTNNIQLNVQLDYIRKKKKKRYRDYR